MRPEIGSDGVRGAVDLHDRDRVLQPARRLAVIDSGHRGDPGQLRAEGTSEQRHHATAVGDARGEDATGVDAHALLQRLDHVTDKRDVVGPITGGSDVPRRTRRVGIGDDEPV